MPRGDSMRVGFRYRKKRRITPLARPFCISRTLKAVAAHIVYGDMEFKFAIIFRRGKNCVEYLDCDLTRGSEDTYRDD